MNRRTFLLNPTAAGFALAAQPLKAAATLPPISTNTYPWGTFAKRGGGTSAWHTDAALAAIAATGITGYEPIINSPAELDGLGARLRHHGLQMPSLRQLTLEQAVETGLPKTTDAVAAHRESLANTRRLFDWLLIYSRMPVDPKTLKRGLNRIELLSDTEHHGIEVIYPGPALVVRYRTEGDR